MRRQLTLLGLATTVLVVVSLLVPLALLVKRQAADSAQVSAERRAQSAAALVALATTLDESPERVAELAQPTEVGVIVVLMDGTELGDALDGQGTLVAEAAADEATVTATVEGGWEIALPVISPSGTTVVDVFVTDEQLMAGVMESWLLLAMLGVFLVGMAVWVADRLGRRFVGPINVLADTANRLSGGNLDVRADVSAFRDVPLEIEEVAAAFNTLASRLDQLLAEEREAVADLSHRLRTPLTSLRLQAERIESLDDRVEILAQVDRLERAVRWLIEASRQRVSEDRGRARLDEVARERAEFWRLLAIEQERDVTVALGAGDVEVSMSAESLATVVDVLIDNVFAHTPAGTALAVQTGVEGGSPWLDIADSGPGFVDESAVERGFSGAGSTGLGLDIARRTAEMAGGAMEMHNRPQGGAVVRIWFEPASV